MNLEQLKQMESNKGFIAALDQSGGSTPKALKAYGVDASTYQSEEEMFDLIHQMRTRMLTSKAMSSEKVIGVILFEQTMKRKVEGLFTATYCWQKKGIVPFLKVDKGLADEKNGCKCMKEFDGLDALLKEAVDYEIFGTKMRSVIYEANPEGIKEVVEQQFTWAKKIAGYGLVPIIEPEVDIHCPDKMKAEDLLKIELVKQLNTIHFKVMLKLTLPTKTNLYEDVSKHPNVVRIVALSGGYSLELATDLLAKNKHVVASFSRALAQNLNVNQSQEEFEEALGNAIAMIYDASVHKRP